MPYDLIDPVRTCVTVYHGFVSLFGILFTFSVHQIEAMHAMYHFFKLVVGNTTCGIPRTWGADLFEAPQ